MSDGRDGRDGRSRSRYAAADRRRDESREGRREHDRRDSGRDARLGRSTRHERSRSPRSRDARRTREDGSGGDRNDDRHTRNDDRHTRNDNHHARNDTQAASRQAQRALDVEIHPLLLAGSAGSGRPAGGALIPKAAFSTAQANIRAGGKDSLLLRKHVDATTALLAIRPPDITRNPFYDPSLPTAARSHRPRALHFQQPGTHTQQAEHLRTEAEVERLRREISESLGRVAGMDTEIVADLLASDALPDADWWDAPFLHETGLPKMDLVSNLIQRPALLPPPVDAAVAPRPLMLTTAEQRKMRRQRRLAEHKEKQEQVKLGLREPDPPKVRIANIARLLGTEAAAEPSRVEAEIRAQAEARLQTHLRTNEERSASAKANAPKKERAMVNISTAVFRVDRLTPPQWRFKVVKNAQQYGLTGCVLYYGGMNLVLAEGEETPIRRYKHLLLDRIDWQAAPDGCMDAFGGNRCVMVWEGVVKERAFGRFEVKEVSTEIDAKEYLERFGLEHYWRLAKDT